VEQGSLSFFQKQRSRIAPVIHVEFNFLFAGNWGISRLRKLAIFGNLISSRGESASHGIALLNRLEQLKLQRRDLFFRRALFFTDPNVQNAIDLVDAEIKGVQGELAKIARLKRKESEK
jgi:hypothetical protein